MQTLKRLGDRLVEVVGLDSSGHVATLDVDAPEIFARSGAFFRAHARLTSTSETP